MVLIGITQVLVSLMAAEQAVSASQMVQAWVALASLIVQMQVTFASLTVEKHRASVSKVTWEQMALASLMDSAVLDSFQ